MDTMNFGGGMLMELTQDECWEMLEAVPVGRLIWAGSEGLTAVPVNYLASDGRLLIRTAAYTAMARECDDSLVAFEVDDIDPSTRSGWSVLVRGRAKFDYGARADEGPEPWASGTRRLHIVIQVGTVTGRRLLPS